MADSPQILMDERQAMAIDARASQLNGATQRENLGLAIKHDSVATIRKVGEDLVFTPDQLAFVISEIKKCRKDIVYFANTYFRIIGDGGLQVIKLYPKQEEMLRAMQKESRLIVLAPRQVGKSTTYSIYFLWQTIFFPDKRIAIASDAAAKAEEILARIKLAYEYLPKEIKPAVTAYSTKQIAFDNNSEIRAFATGGNSLAGFSCVTGDTKVTIADDFGGIWYTDIDKVESIANSSIPVNTNGMDELTMKKYNFVYKTINTINGKEYTGVHSTDDLNDGYLGSGRAIKAAIEKYGPECFTKSIVKMCENRQEALKLEEQLVDQSYVDREDTYNLVIGGGDAPVRFGEDNGFYGKHHDEKTRERMKKAKAEYWSSHTSKLIGYNFSEDDDVVVDGVRYNSINDMSIKLKIWQTPNIMELLLRDGNGFVNSDRQEQLKIEYEQYLNDKEVRHQHHVEAIRARCKDPEYRKKLSNSLKGKSHWWQDKVNKNPEKIRKMAEKHRGMKRSEEAKKHMSEARRKFFNEKGGSVSNKGKILITNLITREHQYISKDQPIPEGWGRGLCKS